MRTEMARGGKEGKRERGKEGKRERVWVVGRGHPIAQDLDESFVLEHEEMYGEQFSVPEPLETVFISWFAGGEVFRSGMTWRRGAGNVFYFQPGHETYPTYHDANVQQVLRNSVKWAFNPQPAGPPSMMRQTFRLILHRSRS